MKFSTTTRAWTLSAALVGTLALSACGAANEGSTGATGSAGASGSDSASSDLSGTVNGAGASSQQAAIQRWTADFSSIAPDVTVNYDPVGSGGGREQFIAGGTSFAGSDAYLSDDELADAEERCNGGEVFELPNYISPIAIVFNLDGVDEMNLGPATLAGIFNGSITTWDAPEIVAENPDATLPSTAITPVHRGDDSGTTQNFTDYLEQTSGGVWVDEADGEWPLSGGEAANGTSGMIAAVQAGAGSIGYADASQAGELSLVNVGVGSDYVAPSPEAAAAVVENSPTVEGRGEYDFAIDVNRTTETGGEYPIVLVSYHIGCIDYDDANEAALVQAFMGYVISEDGQDAAAESAGSAPISDALRDQAQTAVDAITAS